MVYIVRITTREKLWTHCDNPADNYSEQVTTYQFADGDAATAFVETAARHASDFVSAVIEYVVAVEDRDF